MLEAEVVKIGNAHGVRLPQRIISRYRFGTVVLLEETQDGVLIHAAKEEKLSWEDTYKEMAAVEHKEWHDWQEMDIAQDTHL